MCGVARVLQELVGQSVVENTGSSCSSSFFQPGFVWFLLKAAAFVRMRSAGSEQQSRREIDKN